MAKRVRRHLQIVGDNGDNILNGGAGGDDFRFVGRDVKGSESDAILDLDFGAGDRVALLLTDGTPFVTTLLAFGRIGAIAVLPNWRLAPA